MMSVLVYSYILDLWLVVLQFILRPAFLLLERHGVVISSHDENNGALLERQTNVGLLGTSFKDSSADKCGGGGGARVLCAGVLDAITSFFFPPPTPMIRFAFRPALVTTSSTLDNGKNCLVMALWLLDLLASFLARLISSSVWPKFERIFIR
mmetsp:Transcript_4685/g.7126  ORF Transcript_4685/g.7126 Transcript_4685/m.7126 type:complete len:152 (-) Transcript_4685:411-866(-)